MTSLRFRDLVLKALLCSALYSMGCSTYRAQPLGEFKAPSDYETTASQAIPEGKVDLSAVLSELKALRSEVAALKPAVDDQAKDRATLVAYDSCHKACDKQFPWKQVHKAADWSKDGGDEALGGRVMNPGYESWYNWVKSAVSCREKCSENEPIGYQGC
jgi:hypothetical protein